MIVAIKGKLYKSSPLQVVIETACGLFYEVNIAITTAEKLPRLNEEVFLHTVAIYREDSQTLYGFATTKDRDFFKILVEKVSGIGPRIAINILSRMSVETLEGAISAGDVTLLSKCPGIGKKTAQRLIIELKDLTLSTTSMPTGTQIEMTSPKQSSNFADAVGALIALGFKMPDADKAVRIASDKLGEDASVEDLIKLSLKTS